MNRDHRRLHPTAAEPAPVESGSSLETRVAVIGADLSSTLAAVIDSVPGAPHGPVGLARTLGLDKVLTSRLLKAARHRDPIAVTHLVPGPEPLRKLLRAAEEYGVDRTLVQDAERAVESFESLIRREAGDRSGLDAIISAWLPEARKPFELRRKQSAFKAMSQIKGAAAETSLATVIVRPSDDGERLDVVWILGLLGLQRLRPGANVRWTSRRMGGPSPRRPTTLVGRPVEGAWSGPDQDGLLLREYSTDPPPEIVVRTYGEAVHYLLGGEDFGPRSAVDLVFAEANFNEIERYVPKGSGRKGYFFGELSTPVKSLLFDAYLHRDVYPGQTPELYIYDTVLEGVASVNDRSRDIDLLDLAERTEDLGSCARGFSRAADVPNYTLMLRDVFDRLAWNVADFRGHRCRIEYPIYGSQVAMAFTPPEK